jgi:hypothetical protein
MDFHDNLYEIYKQLTPAQRYYIRNRERKKAEALARYYAAKEPK